MDIYRHLISGGKLILEQPDISYAAKVLLGDVKPPAGAEGQFDLWPLYGDPTSKNPLYMHKWGYTRWSLLNLVQCCGFKNAGVLPAKYHYPVRDFRIEAVK